MRSIPRDEVHVGDIYVSGKSGGRGGVRLVPARVRGIYSDHFGVIYPDGRIEDIDFESTSHPTFLIIKADSLEGVCGDGVFNEALEALKE